MNGPELLEHAAGLIKRRRREYGEPVDVFEAVAKRWSLVFGTKVTAAQSCWRWSMSNWSG
jgi:hypothetical protein